MKTSFDAATDKKHELKIESKILYALWRHGIARAGSEAPIEVRTVFVGQGADIEIAGKSSRGKAPGKIKGKIYNNRFTGRLPVPETIDPQAVVWFEAKLPKHGLKIESNKIPTGPKIVVHSMQWDREEARRGDVVGIRAQFEGVRGHEDAVVKIMEYEGSGMHHPVASLSTQLEGGKIELEWEYQFPEDTGEVPVEEELREHGEHYGWPRYFFVIDIEGQRFGEEQESGLLMFKDYIEISLVDEAGAPLAGREFTLKQPDGTEITGTLDDDGYARVEDVAPGPYTVVLSDQER
jgi:hypothetical protein